jgi:hypothetical protein
LEASGQELQDVPPLLAASGSHAQDALDEPATPRARRPAARLPPQRLREQIEAQRRLCQQLEAIAARLRAAGEVSVDELLRAIEGMTMIETYFTLEQLESIRERREELGEEHPRQKQADWAELIALIRAEMERGTDPEDAKVQALAQRWQRLMDESGLGDPAMKQSVEGLWVEQGDDLVAQYGSDLDSRPVSGYLDQAFAAAKGST